MRITLAVPLVAALYGCGIGAPIVKHDTVSFDEVIEDTTNKMLLANILRARDKAPLHFSEVAKISESIKMSAGLSGNLGARNTGTPSLSYEVDPSFDVSHVTGKDFATGIASPINSKFVKYWRDRGLDQRVLLFLFFSGADIIEETDDGKTRNIVHIANSPRDAIDREPDFLDIGTGHDACPKSEFARYLRLINNLALVEIPAQSKDEPVATVDFDPSRRPDRILSSLASLDASKYKFKCKEKEKKCSVSAAGSGDPTICYKSHWYFPQAAECSTTSSSKIGFVKESADSKRARDSEKSRDEEPTVVHVLYSQHPKKYCALYEQFAPPLERQEELRKKPEAPPKGMRMELSVRSVGEVIQYLGDILALQEYVDGQRAAHHETIIHSPLTLGYCEGREELETQSGCGDYLFRVKSNEEETPRFSLEYRGDIYSIAAYASNKRPVVEVVDPRRQVADAPRCGAPGVKCYPVRDHSLEVLAVLGQLIALNREAKDVVTTPTVRIVP